MSHHDHKKKDKDSSGKVDQKNPTNQSAMDRQSGHPRERSDVNAADDKGDMNDDLKASGSDETNKDMDRDEAEMDDTTTIKNADRNPQRKSESEAHDKAHM